MIPEAADNLAEPIAAPSSGMCHIAARAFLVWRSWFNGNAARPRRIEHALKPWNREGDVRGQVRLGAARGRAPEQIEEAE